MRLPSRRWRRGRGQGPACMQSQPVCGLGARTALLLILIAAHHCSTSSSVGCGIAARHAPSLVPSRLRGGAEQQEEEEEQEQEQEQEREGVSGFMQGVGHRFEAEIKSFRKGEPLNSGEDRPRIPPSPASLLRGDPQEIARWERRRRAGRGPAKGIRTVGKGRIFSHYHEIDRILCRRLRFSSIEAEAEEDSGAGAKEKGADKAEGGASSLSSRQQHAGTEHRGDQGTYMSGGQRRRERMLDLAERAMTVEEPPPAEDIGKESQPGGTREDGRCRERVKTWLIPRYGASGETEEDAIRAAIRKAMPGIAARNGYNETQLVELQSQVQGTEHVTIPKPITAEKYDAVKKNQREWEKRQRLDNEANEGRGKHREGAGKDPELDMIMQSFDNFRDVTERRIRERGKRARR